MCIEIGFCRIRDIKPYREVFAPKTENMWRIIKNKRVIMTLPELQVWVCDGFSKPVCHLLLGYRQAVRQWNLTPRFVGSNPTSPVRLKGTKNNRKEYIQWQVDYLLKMID